MPTRQRLRPVSKGRALSQPEGSGHKHHGSAIRVRCASLARAIVPSPHPIGGRERCTATNERHHDTKDLTCSTFRTNGMPRQNRTCARGLGKRSLSTETGARSMVPSVRRSGTTSVPRTRAITTFAERLPRPQEQRERQAAPEEGVAGCPLAPGITRCPVVDDLHDVIEIVSAASASE